MGGHILTPPYIEFQPVNFCLLAPIYGGGVYFPHRMKQLPQAPCAQKASASKGHRPASLRWHARRTTPVSRIAFSRTLPGRPKRCAPQTPARLLFDRSPKPPQPRESSSPVLFARKCASPGLFTPPSTVASLRNAPGPAPDALAATPPPQRAFGRAKARRGLLAPRRSESTSTRRTWLDLSKCLLPTSRWLFQTCASRRRARPHQPRLTAAFASPRPA
jgi:hypothetical protein